jgi:hypothetical protein
MIQSFSTLAEKLARAGFLAILDAAGVVPVVGEIIEALLIVQDAVMMMFNVTSAGVQITDITALLIQNLIRIYKQNDKKVTAAHDRINDSVNTFNNTNTPDSDSNTNNNTNTQSGGRKKNTITKSRRKKQKYRK